MAKGETAAVETVSEDPAPPKRQHVATYARDKRNPGQYLIRVEGPNASKFEGREVPVTRKDHSESNETLESCIWAGIDDESAKPVALYRFAQKPREDKAADTAF